jgi:hypothetical protein
MTRAQAEAAFYEGSRLMAAGDAGAAAQACFERALELAPELAEAIINLGWLRAQAKDLIQAERFYREAIARNPTLTRAWLLLGVLLMDAKRFVEAEQIYRQVALIASHEPDVWSNFGVLLACLQREEEAEQCYLKALALQPHHAMSRFNLSYLLLRQERWEQGWLNLESRWQYEHLTTHFTCPRWRGESLHGKALVIGFEAGHGDMIFYSRYVALVKARGATTISIVCHPGLVALFSRMEGIDQALSFHADVPHTGWDYWVPPMSLPYLCATRADTLPATVPYLTTDPEIEATWARRSGSIGPGLRVGLVWNGNADFENDADRSLHTLDLLRPLSAIPGVCLISLQKGHGEAEAACPPEGMSLLAWGSELHDFADTAGLVANLDLVISVDTAVAHLAGALGKPCWLLLPDYRADWRWHTRRSDSPWYPCMRLFRQPHGGGWETVIAEVVAALTRLLVSRNVIL